MGFRPEGALLLLVVVQLAWWKASVILSGCACKARLHTLHIKQGCRALFDCWLCGHLLLVTEASTVGVGLAPYLPFATCCINLRRSLPCRPADKSGALDFGEWVEWFLEKRGKAMLQEAGALPGSKDGSEAS